MGSVAITAKVFPENMEDFDKVMELIQNEMKPYKIEGEEVAFGMKVIRVTFLVKDSSGGGDIEERLRKVKGVSEVQVEEVTLI